MNDRQNIDLETDDLDQLKHNKNQTKKPYLSPRLEKFGRFSDLTLGGSFGIGDSGSIDPADGKPL
jgi:hypothetical protein